MKPKENTTLSWRCRIPADELVLVSEQFLEIGLAVRVHAGAHVTLEVQIGVRGQREFIAKDQRRDDLRLVPHQEIAA